MVRYNFLWLLIILVACNQETQEKQFLDTEDKTYPNYGRDLERNYPEQDLQLEAYMKGKRQVQRDIQQLTKSTDGFDNEWIVQGPGNIGARINTVAIDPRDENIIFAGYSGGGLWRSQDKGDTWESVFDAQLYNCIGHITFHPEDSNIIYVGTGDPNITGRAYIGDGLYKSEDGGDSWTKVGLSDQNIISKVRVDTNDPDIMYVGSLGLPFTKNNTRGLYKTTDGGSSWDQVFFYSDSTGVADVILDPEQPEIVHIATWDRVRSYVTNIVVGEGSGIFSSYDGGSTWKRAEGIPDTTLCRCGITVCQNAPNNVFAITVGSDRSFSAIYRSQDHGRTYQEIPTDSLRAENPLRNFGWFFAKIEVNPNDPDNIFVLGVDLWETKDGGLNWEQATPPWWQYEVHADKHDLDILPNGDMYLATDGGLYRSHIDDREWVDVENIPTTQFYRVAYNPHNPTEYYGGAQDNGTTAGNEDNINEWPRIYGGDGFQPVFDPIDPLHYFAETQNGGLVVTIDDEFFFDGTVGLEGERNWDMPYIMSPHDPGIMYAGTDRMHITFDTYFPFWEPISDNLCIGGYGGAVEASLTAIDESPLEFGLLYAGSNNGHLWMGRSGGSWTDISEGLPDRYITSVKASPSFLETAYVSVSGYKNNEFIPRVFRTDDLGSTWIDISGDLPDVAVNDVYIAAGQDDRIIFVATDGGVYGTIDEGQNWERIGSNMPNLVVYDLAYNEWNQEIIAATFGRSIMTYDITEILETVSVSELAEPLTISIFPNPADDICTISTNNEIDRIELYDAAGRLIRLLGADGSRTTLDMSDQVPGIYMLKIHSAGQYTYKKLIKS